LLIKIWEITWKHIADKDLRNLHLNKGDATVYSMVNSEMINNIQTDSGDSKWFIISINLVLVHPSCSGKRPQNNFTVVICNKTTDRQGLFQKDLSKTMCLNITHKWQIYNAKYTSIKVSLSDQSHFSPSFQWCYSYVLPLPLTTCQYLHYSITSMTRPMSTLLSVVFKLISYLFTSAMHVLSAARVQKFDNEIISLYSLSSMYAMPTAL